MKYILSLLVATTFAVAQEVGVEVEEKVEVQKVIKHAGLTREEIALVRTEQEHYVVNDIITRQTVFITMDKAMELFVKSLDYYNRNLARTTKEALIKAKKENKRFYVNIVGGSDIPQHAFKGRNNVYKVDEYPHGQHTVFYVGPDGRIFKDHYECGSYGQLGRDGVSMEHAVKTFGALEIRNATKRAAESDKNFDWEVVVSFPDMERLIVSFDKYEEYEEWYNRTRYPDKHVSMKKVKALNLSKK